MKKIIIIGILLLATVAFAKEQEQQKFSVTFTIEYKDMTLKQLADIEKRIKDEFEKANSIRIEFQKKPDESSYPSWYNAIPLYSVTPAIGETIGK